MGILSYMEVSIRRMPGGLPFCVSRGSGPIEVLYPGLLPIVGLGLRVDVCQTFRSAFYLVQLQTKATTKSVDIRRIPPLLTRTIDSNRGRGTWGLAIVMV